jgi:hypothetical protein
MTKFFDDAAAENARKIIAEDRKAMDVSRAEATERLKGKPTPTQEENDLAAAGAHILEHDDDGSGPDPFNAAVNRRQMEAGKQPATYKTKTQTPTT